VIFLGFLLTNTDDRRNLRSLAEPEPWSFVTEDQAA